MFRKRNYDRKSVPDVGPCVGKALSFPLLTAKHYFSVAEARETLHDDFRYVLPFLPRWWRQKTAKHKTDFGFLRPDREQRRYSCS